MVGKEIKEDEDILLRIHELAMESVSEFKKEQDDLSLANKESDGGFKPKIEEENREDFHERVSHSSCDIKEDKGIIMESGPEFKKKQDDLSLANKESDGGFKPGIEEENREDFHEHLSHSSCDIKEDKGIIMESGPEFNKEQDDLSLANKESDGGFKSEAEEENREDIHEHVSHSSCDIKEVKDIIMESGPEFKKEQDDLSLANKESDDGFKPEMEEENQEDLHEHVSHSSCDIKEDEDIILRLNESLMESVRESVHAADLTGQQILADKESDGGFKHKIEEEKQEDLHEDTSQSPTDIEKDEDMILRLNRLFLEAVRQFLADRERSEEENQEDLHEDTPHSRYIKKNKDIILRLDKLFMESVREFKTKQVHRSLADEESHGGLKHKIEEQNQEDLEDALHSRYDIKEGENIILRLNESFMESVRESVDAVDKFKKEQNDMQGDLNLHQSQDRRSLADKESHGGFKHKIKEATREDLPEDASHLQFDIKENEDIILQFNKLAMESDSESVTKADKLKKEQKGARGNDEESDGGSKHKIEEDEAPRIKKNPEESNSSDDVETFEITEFPKVRTGNVNPFDMALGPLEELEEIGLKFFEFMDHTFSILKDVQRVKYKEEDKYDFLENVRLLLLTSSRKVDIVIDELEVMKNDENEENSSSTIAQMPEIALFQEVEINAKLVKRSFLHTIAFLFDDKCREKELSCCVAELNRSMENLKVVLLRIRPRKWLLSRAVKGGEN